MYLWLRALEVLYFICRAFSWTTFHDEAGCNSLSPGPSSAIMQRSTYYGFIPTSPHISRLSVIKQESIDQPDVFGDYYLSSNVEGKEVQESVAIGKSSKEKPCVYSEAKTVITYPAPQSPAFPTPATPSPLSPMNFPPTSTFFPPHFHPKLSSYSWSGSLLSPAPSLHSSSQEELAQCRSWKLEVQHCFRLYLDLTVAKQILKLLSRLRKMKWRKNHLIMLLLAERSQMRSMVELFPERTMYTASLNPEHLSCANAFNGRVFLYMRLDELDDSFLLLGLTSSCHQLYPRVLKNVIKWLMRRPLQAWLLLLLNAQWMVSCFSLKNIASSSSNSSQVVIIGKN